jgi:hypothetical protein
MLKDIFEETVILLQDGVLGGHLKWVASLQGVVHAGSGETVDGLFSVIHTHVAAWSVEFVDLLLGWCAAIGWMEDNLGSSWNLLHIILASVLITISVSANNDWLGPAWNNSWNVLDDDWLSEDGTVEDVSNGTVW